MANQLIIERALDGNGYVLPGAKATITLTGTTTLATVYSDSDGSTPAANPIVADANGFWPQRFVTVTPRAVVTDADDVTLYTLDPVPTTFATGAAASGVSFAPSIAVPESNVQDAIEYVAGSVLSGVSAFGIGVTGNAPLLANIDATGTASGAYRFDGATAGTYPTGVAAADTGLVEHWRQSATTAMQFLFHATTDRVFHRRMASTTWGTWREVLTVNQGAAEGDIIYRGASAWARLAKGTAGQGLIMNAAATAPEWASAYTWNAVATNGAALYDVGSIPAWATDIVCSLVTVSLATTTDQSFIQIGTGGSPSVSGYTGSVASIINATASVATFQSPGFLMGSSTDDMTGHLRITRRSGTNEWVASGQARRTIGGQPAVNVVAGAISLGGSLNIVRLIRSGAGNYNGGIFAVGYR